MPRSKRTIELEEAAAGRPIITVTATDIARFAKQRSVWDGLYLWLIDKHKAGDNYTLHNRTRVGKALMKRLYDAEKARIKKQHRISGEKLNQAMFWSNTGSGPMETHEGTGRTILGDGLYLIAESVWNTRR